MAVMTNPTPEQVIEFGETVIHLGEFLQAGLAYFDDWGDIQFLPLYNDDTELT